MKRKIFVVKRGKTLSYVGMNFDKAIKTYLRPYNVDKWGPVDKSFTWYILGLPRKKYVLHNERNLTIK